MKKTVLRLMTSSCLLCLATLPAAAFTAYVSNEKGNSISVIDTDTKEVVKTIKTGNRPRGLLAPDMLIGCRTARPAPPPPSSHLYD